MLIAISGTDTGGRSGVECVPPLAAGSSLSANGNPRGETGVGTGSPRIVRGVASSRPNCIDCSGGNVRPWTVCRGASPVVGPVSADTGPSSLFCSAQVSIHGAALPTGPSDGISTFRGSGVCMAACGESAALSLPALITPDGVDWFLGFVVVDLRGGG